MRTYLGVGANLAAPVAQIDEAATRLGRAGVEVLRRSRLYGSKPVGPQNQPDYVNAVFEADTELGPIELLRACQAVEDTMGRIRQERWGARLIDVDVLLYGEEQFQSPDLVVPHPEMHRRSFVLRPLAELAPALRLPGTGEAVADLSQHVREPEVWALEELS